MCLQIHDTLDDDSKNVPMKQQQVMLRNEREMMELEQQITKSVNSSHSVIFILIIYTTYLLQLLNIDTGCLCNLLISIPSIQSKTIAVPCQIISRTCCHVYVCLTQMFLFFKVLRNDTFITVLEKTQLFVLCKVLNLGTS